VIAGNYLGTNLAGTASSGVTTNNDIYVLDAANTTIGGTAAGARNLISGSGAYGIRIDNSSSGTIQGNWIGTDATGTGAIANVSAGVFLDNASGIVVGGTAAGTGNVISGGATGNPAGPGYGVYIGNTAFSNTVQGNYIGTDYTGTLDLGNKVGVYLVQALTNQIGGTTAAARNIIAGNDTYGVQFTGSATQGNQFQGNWVGLNVNGVALANGVGVRIDGSAHDNTLGGTATGAGNVIGGNSLYGVQVDGATTTGNVVQNNTIGSVANTSGSLSITNSASVKVGGTFTGDVSNGGTLDLNGNAVSIVGALTGSGTVTNSVASGTATLTVNGTGTFGGVIQSGGSAATALTVAEAP